MIKFRVLSQHRNKVILLCALAALCSVVIQPRGGRGLAGEVESGLIGIRIGISEPYPRILGVIKGTPADKSGRLIPGMLILGIVQPAADGTYVSLRGRRSTEIASLLAGAAGSRVILEVAGTTRSGIVKTESVEIIRGDLLARNWEAQPFITKVSTLEVYDTNLLVSLCGSLKGAEEFIHTNTLTYNQHEDVRAAVEALIR